MVVVWIMFFLLVDDWRATWGEPLDTTGFFKNYFLRGLPPCVWIKWTSPSVNVSHNKTKKHFNKVKQSCEVHTIWWLILWYTKRKKLKTWGFQGHKNHLPYSALWVFGLEKKGLVWVKSVHIFPYPYGFASRMGAMLVWERLLSWRTTIWKKAIRKKTRAKARERTHHGYSCGPHLLRVKATTKLEKHSGHISRNNRMENKKEGNKWKRFQAPFCEVDVAMIFPWLQNYWYTEFWVIWGHGNRLREHLE